MVYSNKFVLCVIANGEPVKELANGTVRLAFEQEYAIRLRNKNNRRAVAKIYIDGEAVSGGGYVIEANNSVDIKRHYDHDRAFKFVSLDSAEAVDFGKNGPNPDKIKGIIEVQFHLEKELQPLRCHYQLPLPPLRFHQPPPQLWYGSYGEGSCGQDRYTYADSVAPQSSGPPVIRCTGMNAGMSAGSLASSAPPQDGCTVEGYSTGQHFYSTHLEYEETYTSLKIFLQGYEPIHSVGVVEPRKTNKDRQLSDLERENEDLRQKLAEIENRQLKERLRREEAND